MVGVLHVVDLLVPGRRDGGGGEGKRLVVGGGVDHLDGNEKQLFHTTHSFEIIFVLNFHISNQILNLQLICDM